MFQSDHLYQSVHQSIQNKLIYKKSLTLHCTKAIQDFHFTFEFSHPVISNILEPAFSQKNDVLEYAYMAILFTFINAVFNEY